MENFENRVQSMTALIDITCLMIQALLVKLHIPYESFTAWKNTQMAPNTLYYADQIRFPWCEGDVVIGMMHITDDWIFEDKENWIKVTPYPSIETFNFPWDSGDVTVFHSPEKFVQELYKYYKEVTQNG